MKKLMCGLVAVTLCGSVFAGGGAFWNTADTDWYTAANWTGGGAPSAGENGWINGTASVGSGTASVNWMYVGHTQDGVVNVASGAVLNAAGLRAASADTQERNGTLNISGTLNVSSELVVGEWGTGSLVLNGNANVNAASLALYLGMNPASTGYLELNDNAYMSIAWLNMEGTYWGKQSNATVMLNGGTLSLGYTGGITIWEGLAGNKIVFNGGKLVCPGDWTGTAQWIYANSARFAVGAGQTFSATYDAGSDLTTVTTVPEPMTMVLLGLGAILVRRKKCS